MRKRTFLVPDDNQARIRYLAKDRDICINTLAEELATRNFAEFEC